MPRIHPAILTSGPAHVLAFLGGLTAMVLLSALLFLAPVLGFPFLDVPRLVGGLFTEDPNLAFWVGYCLFFIPGLLVFPPLLAFAWPLLPGRNEGWRGAAIKGLTAGVILWIPGGALLPVLESWNQLSGFGGPGFFALGEGFLGALGFLLGHLAYGVSLALVADMGQSINPFDVIGWSDYRPGYTPLLHPGYRQGPKW